MSAEHYLHHEAAVRALIAEAEARGAVRAGERIAQAIEAHAEEHLPTWLRDNFTTAARIARADRIEAAR